MTPSKQRKVTEPSKILDAQELEKRAKFPEEPNGLRTSLSALPPEILSIIFVYAFRSPRKQLYRTVSLVSKRWRRVLVSTPEAWTTIDLDVGSPRGRMALLPFIANSSDRALSVTLRFRRLFDQDETLVSPNVDPRLVESFGRIESLELTNPPISWFSQLLLLQRMQSLTLKGHRGHGVPTNIAVDRIPTLTELTLVHLKNVLLYSTCTNLTSLTLTQLHITTSVRIFIKCPNLKKLHLEYMGRVLEGNDWGGEDMIHPPNQTLALEHLEIFEWFACKPEDFLVLLWQLAIENQLNLPSLRSLKWDQREETTLLFPTPTFWNRVALTLTEVEFSRVRVVDGNMFSDDYPVERIVFSDCDPGFVDAVLENVQSPERLPKLRNVEMKMGGRFLEGPRILKSLRERVKVSGGGMVFNGVSVM
jgi:hypothetical protein